MRWWPRSIHIAKASAVTFLSVHICSLYIFFLALHTFVVLFWSRLHSYSIKNRARVMTVVLPICLCSFFPYIFMPYCILTQFQRQFLLRFLRSYNIDMHVLPFTKILSSADSILTLQQTIFELFLDHKTTRHLYHFDDFFSPHCCSACLLKYFVLWSRASAYSEHQPTESCQWFSSISSNLYHTKHTHIHNQTYTVTNAIW